MPQAHFDRHEDHVLLPFRKKLFYGFGGLGDTLLGNGMTQVAAIFNIVFKVDAFWIGVILLAPRIWDAVTDPLMGHLSDNTRTRWGRRRPYVFCGGLITAGLFFLMLCPPTALGSRGLLGYLLLLSMLYFTAYTVFSVSYNALGLEMSLDYHERTRVMGFRSFLNSGGGILASWGLWLAYRPELGSPVTGARLMGLIFALVAGGAFVMVVLGVREAGDVQQQAKIGFAKSLKFTATNLQFLLLSVAMFLFMLGLLVWIPLQQYVNFYYVFGGDVGAGTRLAGLTGSVYNGLKLLTVILIAWIGTRLGKDKTLGIGLVVSGAGMILTWFLFTPAHPYWQLAIPVFLAFSLPTLEIFPQAIMADICDLDELKTGLRREGMFGASLGFVMKLAIAGTQFVTGGVLRFVGFDPSLEGAQPPEVLFKLRILTVLIPFALITIAGLILFSLRVPEKRIREVRAILEARRQEDLDKGE